MKKLLATVIPILALLALVAGCAKTEVASPAPETAPAEAMTTPLPASTTTSTTAPASTVVPTQEQSPTSSITPSVSATTAPSPTPTATPTPEPMLPLTLTEPIEMEYGLVCGMVINNAGNEIHIYKGIPYAAPPLGDLRWKPPQPPASWTGVRECTRYTAVAPQDDTYGIYGTGISEDCLYLNVLTPDENPAERLPVMVWLHGGGYHSGSGNDYIYNLPGLPGHGVVLVTVNMRLSVLGLLAHPLLSEESPQRVSGNYMFLDIIAALEWVRDNIAAFGGDPDNITIFGQSGGGAKVASLMASPLAKGLFHKAIMESGTAIKGLIPGFSGLTLEDMEERGRQIFVQLGVDKAADPLAAARALPWEDVIDVSMGLDATIDGWFLTDAVMNTFTEGKQNPVPFITVANLGEITGPGMFLALFPALIPGYTNMLANAHKAGVKAYAAIFEYVPYYWKADGAVNFHGMEILYVFGDMDPQSSVWKMMKMMAPSSGAKNSDPGLGEVDRQLSEYMMQMWTQFARTGNPTVPGLVEWPAYDAASDKYLTLDIPLEVKTGFSLIAPEEYED